MAVSLGECMCLLRVRGGVGISCWQTSARLVVCVCVCECVRVYVCVYVCVFGSVNLSPIPTLTYPLTLTTTAFQPQSKVELQDAVQTCGVGPMKK